MVERRTGGLYVPALGWWLDGTTPRSVGFTSHAHSDHMARHGRVVCTPETAELLRVWFDGAVPVIEAVPVDEWRAASGGRWRLLPSGHILGGAMLHLETSGGSVLYAGDVRLEGSPTALPARPCPADLLIVEDTFGAVEAPFLDAAAAAGEVVALCRELRRQGRTPVLVSLSNCGKAQDAVAALCAAGLVPALQPKVWRFAEAYRRLGRLEGGYVPLVPQRRNDCDACVVTRAYLQHCRAALPAMVSEPFIVLLSGWAATDHAEQYDAAIPWSDHASREGLLSIVASVAPARVWTFAGDGSLARHLARSGLAAEHIG